MNILFIADPVIPVPPTHYGGAERIVHLYAQEFARLGHSIHILAGPGSRGYGGPLHVYSAPSNSYLSRLRRKSGFQIQSLLAAIDCDVVYNHARFDYLEALLAINKPMLHCFHNPIDQGQIDFAERRMKSRSAFHFLSESQRSHALISMPNVLIPNSVDTFSICPGGGEGGYLVFLGRLTRNKGVDIAIAVALLSGKKLVIAGNVSDEEGGKTFFRQEVEPYLDGEQIRWIGEVDDLQKQCLLGQAEALLFPINWDEPFGLVMIEALACGTPVIATMRASTPEVIDDGVTGFLCDAEEPRVESFAEAVRRLPEIRRSSCRQAAEKRFDVRVICLKILDALSNLSSGNPLSFQR